MICCQYVAILKEKNPQLHLKQSVTDYLSTRSGT
jgi:hypothetical protein